MRVLMVTAGLPYPAHQGGAIRIMGLLRGLHAAGHHVTLLCAVPAPPSEVPVALQALCEAVVTVPTPPRTRTARLRDLLLSGAPDVARRWHTPLLAAALARLLAARPSYDVAHFAGIEAATGLLHVAGRAHGTALVYDAFNAEADLQRTIARTDARTPRRWPLAAYSWVQARRLARHEAALGRAAAAVLAVSREDAAALAALAPTARVHVVPNGLDTSAYPTDIPAAPLPPHALVFSGKMDYRPNVDAALWFAHEVLPLVRRACPEAHFVVVGQQPAKALNVLRGHPAVTLTGWVADVRPYLRAASVYVAPLRMGSGTRLKVLEAMAAGCAVVGTPLAFSGMRPGARDHLRLADAAPAFADHVAALLADPPARAALGAGASAFVCAHHDWAQVVPHLLAAYEGLPHGS